ncbi:MAG: hypothetical protein ABIA63_02605, partial [bacterium]
NKLNNSAGVLQFRIILVISFATLIALAVFMIFNLKQGAKNIKDQKELCLRVAEEGILKAFNKISEDPEWNRGFETDSSGEIEYRVTINNSLEGPDIREIVSTASIGDIQRKIVSRFKIIRKDDGTVFPQKIPGAYMVY